VFALGRARLCGLVSMILIAAFMPAAKDLAALAASLAGGGRLRGRVR